MSYWTEMGCPHVNTVKTIAREYLHEKCADCGSERTTFAIEPLMKEGQTLAFRAQDFKAEGAHSLADLTIRADNARLRALIDRAEYGNDGHCPWCDREARDLEHTHDCKAFTQDRKVK